MLVRSWIIMWCLHFPSWCRGTKKRKTKFALINRRRAALGNLICVILFCIYTAVSVQTYCPMRWCVCLVVGGAKGKPWQSLETWVGVALFLTPPSPPEIKRTVHISSHNLKEYLNQSVWALLRRMRSLFPWRVDPWIFMTRWLRNNNNNRPSLCKYLYECRRFLTLHLNSHF